MRVYSRVMCRVQNYDARHTDVTEGNDGEMENDRYTVYRKTSDVQGETDFQET